MMETDSEHLGPRQSSRKESARGLVSRARDAERRGDTARSLGLYDDAIEALEREQDPALLADTLRWKGTLHREQGETEAAYRCYTQSLIHAEQCGSIPCKAHAFNYLAIVAPPRANLARREKLDLPAAGLARKAGSSLLLR